MKMSRMLFVVGTIVLLAGGVQAGAKVDSWVIDDFEGYNSSAELFGSPMGLFTGASRWARIQDVRGWEAGLVAFDVSLGVQKGEEDPNGFVPIGSVDEDGPQGMLIHTEVNGAASADVATLCGMTGMPIATVVDAYIPDGQGGYVPYQFGCVDFTRFDTIAFKIKKKPGNPAPTSNFSVTFIGPDLNPIGYFNSEGAFSDTENVWEVIEFDLAAELNPVEGPSTADMTTVALFAFGSYEAGGNAELNYIIDDITVSKKSESCTEYIQADVNLDCQVDLADFAALAADWLAGV